MQLDESRKLLLSDTLIPDIFIMEYMTGLSGLAVKIYLLLLFTVRSGRSIQEQDLARRLGEDSETIRAALMELASVELIAIKDRGLDIMDVKAAEIERAYRPKTASAPLEIVQNQEKFTVREKLMADIAKTFFQGLMSPSWYGEIDSWFDRYGFEPEVIYALFQECARRNKLDSKAYMAKVAENWSGRGIITFNDLNRYFIAYDKVSKACKKIGRKLRKNMTEYDEEIVTRWIEQYGFEFEIIEIALRKTTKLANPNLEFIDRILKEWFEHQLKDPEAIQAFESDKAARLSAGRHSADKAAGEQGGQVRNKGNFTQREYSAEYLNEFYEAVQPAEQSIPDTNTVPAADELPGQIGIADLLKPDDHQD
ncbi:MAG: DnaD domain protein [Clostridiaceae bacterium]|nr:DnaD domain protein [Clostridiaceae bacterium]